MERTLKDIIETFIENRSLMNLDHFNITFFTSKDKEKWKIKKWKDFVDKEDNEKFSFIFDREYPYQELEIYITDYGLKQWPTLDKKQKEWYAVHEFAHAILYEMANKKKHDRESEEAVCDHIASIITQLT